MTTWIKEAWTYEEKTSSPKNRKWIKPHSNKKKTEILPACIQRQRGPLSCFCTSHKWEQHIRYNQYTAISFTRHNISFSNHTIFLHFGKNISILIRWCIWISFYCTNYDKIISTNTFIQSPDLVNLRYILSYVFLTALFFSFLRYLLFYIWKNIERISFGCGEKRGVSLPCT